MLQLLFSMQPSKKDRLSIPEMKAYIDQAKRSYPSIKLLVLTGGECFTYGEELSKIIKYATEIYNMKVRIVSNAYWANTIENARTRLKPYITSGLSEINFSTGDEHQKFVPFNYIKNACLVSVEFGLIPLVNIETREDKIFTAKDFTADKELLKLLKENKIMITNGIWVSFKKENITNKNNHKMLTTQNSRCENLFNSINIDPQHRMLACCGLTAKYIKYLDLGNLKTQSIKKLYENQFNDFLKIWIYVEGPHNILEFISKYIKIDLSKYDNLHDCQICAIIFNNPICLEILKNHYREIYSNVILKYNVINNQS